MLSTAIVCSDCRRIIAVGAGLPATCYAAIPAAERGRLSTVKLEAHPAAHHVCVELPVLVPDDALAGDVLAAVEHRYEEQILVLSELAGRFKPEEAVDGSRGTAG
jgi:hypothetical protein